jgi:hypothetical protein
MAKVMIKRIFLFLLLYFFHNNYALSSHTTEGTLLKEKWITIFIHGSYGTSLTLMSFPKIFRGDSQGTLYKKFQTHFRGNKDFYQNRFMHRLGLVSSGKIHFE